MLFSRILSSRWLMRLIGLAAVAVTVVACAEAVKIRDSSPHLNGTQNTSGTAVSSWCAHAVPLAMLSEGSTHAATKLGPMRNPFASLPMAILQSTAPRAWRPTLGNPVARSRPAFQILFCTWLT